MRRVTTALGAFIVPCLFASMLSAQIPEIRWTRSFKFSVSDKRDVVTLAKLMGVQDPESVDANVRDDCCRIVAVKGRVVENGPERRWPQALMFRDNWREYAGETPPKDRLLKGRWIADGPPQVFVEWRVRDGAWFVDVGRGTDRPSIPYREAELIVLALHRDKIVNEIAGRPSIPTLNSGQTYMLRKGSSRSDASVPEYEVYIGTGRDGGDVLRMRIVGDTVEAVSLSIFEI